MKFTYTLAPEHFVTQILFRISQNEKEMKRLKYGQTIIPFLQVVLAVWMFAKGSYFIAVGFLIMAAVWLIFYPKMMKKRYFTSYTAYVQNNYQKAFGQEVNVELSDSTIVASDSFNTSTLEVSSVKEIVEISEMTMIVLKSGQSVILPQEATTNYDELRNYLKDFSQRLSIPYKEMLDWKWAV